jgi:hypothetical protein
MRYIARERLVNGRVVEHDGDILGEGFPGCMFVHPEQYSLHPGSTSVPLLRADACEGGQDGRAPGCVAAWYLDMR